MVNQVFSGLSPYYGYSGEEDQGLMGTLSALMKLGLFQMSGGCEENPYYEIGSPIFDAITIKLDNNYFKGKSFRIEARNNSSANRYIQSSQLNGVPLQSFRIRHTDIVNGGTLSLQMGPAPNFEWGVAE